MTTSSPLPSQNSSSAPWHEAYRRKQIMPELIEARVHAWRIERRSIATLNGSFDLLHGGHLFILYEASKCAEILLVLLNSDQSIAAYKGKERPFIPLEERMQLIAALEFVSFVTFFHEPDPRELLARICPDVHVNGEEYGENCIEREVVEKGGGRMHLVPRIDGRATSNIVRRIQSACG